MNMLGVINHFLQDQKKRLKQRTFRNYEDVMDHFVLYLDGYGYLHLDDEAEAQYDERKPFTESLGIDVLSASHYSEFLEYFLIAKTFSGESFIKQSITVLRKFANWLFDQEYIDKATRDDLLDYLADGQTKSVKNATQVSRLLFELATRAPDYEYEEILDDYFGVEEIKSKELWLSDYYGETEMIGPVIVTKEISHLCEEGWEMSLLIGKYKGRWFVIESGNVYP